MQKKTVDFFIILFYDKIAEMRRKTCCFAARISQQERWSVLE